MPIFEYRCDACGKEFEELVFGKAGVACPQCRATRVTKQFSVPAPPVSARAAAPAACEGGMPASGCCGGGACQLN